MTKLKYQNLSHTIFSSYNSDLNIFNIFLYKKNLIAKQWVKVFGKK